MTRWYILQLVWSSIFCAIACHVHTVYCTIDYTDAYHSICIVYSTVYCTIDYTYAMICICIVYSTVYCVHVACNCAKDWRPHQLQYVSPGHFPPSWKYRMWLECIAKPRYLSIYHCMCIPTALQQHMLYSLCATLFYFMWWYLWFMRFSSSQCIHIFSADRQIVCQLWCFILFTCVYVLSFLCVGGSDGD